MSFAMKVLYSLTEFAYFLRMIRSDCGWVCIVSCKVSPSRRSSGQDGLLVPESMTLRVGLTVLVGNVVGSFNVTVMTCALNCGNHGNGIFGGGSLSCIAEGDASSTAEIEGVGAYPAGGDAWN